MNLKCKRNFLTELAKGKLALPGLEKEGSDTIHFLFPTGTINPLLNWVKRSKTS